MNDASHKDKEYFNYLIKVEGKDITFKVEGETVMEYTKPEDRAIKLS